MQNQEWLLQRQLDTARLIENHEGRITTLEEDRKRRSSFPGTAAQIVIALCSIAALLVSIFKH